MESYYWSFDILQTIWEKHHIFWIESVLFSLLNIFILCILHKQYWWLPPPPPVYNQMKRKWQIPSCYLPDHNMPCGLLQQGSVGSDGGEQRLPSTFAHSGPWVDTQLAQLGVEAQPQAIKGRGRVEWSVQSLSFLLGLLLQSFLFPLQLLCDGFAPLEEVVRNVPLWVKK